MFEFLNKSPDHRIRNKIQLVSIHIPKTAGTSFRQTLKEVYGAEKVQRLDINGNKILLEQAPITTKKLANNITVVHGHVHYRRLLEEFKISEKAQFITWLRNPVDRVVSNYYYLAKRLAEELDEPAKGLNILSKMQKTLLEYAHAERNRNRMSKFLKGATLEEFAFVGITEHYSEDLLALGKLLKWPEVEEYKVNVTGKQAKVVSEEDKAMIRSLNEEDMTLYEHALELRVQRGDFR